MSDTKVANPPAPTVKLSVDGVEVTVAPGSTIIQATNRAGKYVPHFCYHEGLPIVGQCRMCFVEIEGMPKLATACSQPVAEGMKVLTNTPKVQAGQNGTLEFILLNHPLDCPICDRGGECKLQDYTLEYGPPRSRMHDEKVLRDKHKPISKEIVLDQERCILCTRCTRFSADVDGRTELVVNERGNHSHVDVFESRPLQSPFSGNVVDLCPVGALTAEDFRFVARPWELKRHDAVCTGCAVGCNVTIDTKHRHPGIPRPGHTPPKPAIVRLMPRDNMDVNTWWMCDKGRWGYHFHNEESRHLVMPKIRRTKGTAAVEVSLREIQAHIEASSQASSGAWEFWIDDNVPHEGISWAKEMAASWASRGRKVKAINDTPFAREFLSFWAGRMNSPWTAGAADWSGITTVVAPMSYRDLEQVAPILALRLGQAVRKGKIKWEVKTPAEFAGVTDDGHVAFLALPPKSSAELAPLAKLSASAKLLLLFTQSNSRGLLNEGIAPIEVIGTQLTGAPQGPVFFISQRTQNEPSTALATHLAKAPFLVIADSFSSELAERTADVILPLTPLYESEATMTNLENRRQYSKGIHLYAPNTPSIDKGGPLVNPSLRLL